MHPAAALFLARCHIPHPAPTVYEVGAANHNGRSRDYLPAIPARWVGYDLLPGDGVQVVGDAADTLANVTPCDVMVSTEVMEHCAHWARLLHRMCATVKPGGHLVVTCAGPGREPHGANGGPVLPDEHYGNVSLDDVTAVVAIHGFDPIIAEQVNGDTRYFGRKHTPREAVTE